MNSEVVSSLAKAPWLALLVDEAGAVQYANPAAVEALGNALAQCPAPLAAVWNAENGCSPDEFFFRWEQAPTPLVELKLNGPGSAVIPAQVCICTVNSGGQKCYLLLFPGPDITTADQKGNSVDASLAHKQKLDCALQLARTVSLDFNNALTSIMAHTSLILGKMEPNHPWRSALMEVEKSAARAAEISNDLGAFSRNEKETKAAATGNVNLLLQRNVDAFKSTKMDKEVAWTLQLERKLYAAKFDEAKMQQALLKIMENAVEALGDRGRIILQTKNLDLTQATQDRNARLAAGSYVCAEISDNGCGIDAETLPRIFEPFFTTKRGPKHRGLGLALVYGMVTNSGGGVAVSSQPGTGTSVRVYLPADKNFINDNGPNVTDLKGNQTILMVDDEDLLLTMGQTVLSEYGYRVLTANSGAKALQILSKSDKPIDLLITDLVMPNMSGRELVEQLNKISPYTRVLCSSGYVRPNSDEDIPYLQKPFTSQDLLIKVKQALTPEEAASVD